MRLVTFQNLIKTDQEELATPMRETTDSSDPLGPLRLRADYFMAWYSSHYQAVDRELKHRFQNKLSPENNALGFNDRFETVCWKRNIPLLNVLQWTKEGDVAGFDLDDIIVLKYRIAMLPGAMVPDRTWSALQSLAQKTADFDRLHVKVTADRKYLTVHAERE